MSNTHAIPDTMHEVMARDCDLVPPCIISTTWPTAPGSGLVLAAFATQGYVQGSEQLVYVEQAAISLTISGSPGAYWLALHRDVSTAVAGWTRRPGSHYLWRTNATQPAHPAGGLVFAHVTVTGTNITAVTPVAGADMAAAWRAWAGLGSIATVNSPVPIANGGTAATTAAQARTNLGLGTMATQNANAVGITGGTATGLSVVAATDMQGDGDTLVVQSSTHRVGIGITGPTVLLDVDGDTYVRGNLGLGVTPGANLRASIIHPKNSMVGLYMRASDNDAGANVTMLFQNIASATVGSINTSAVATAYNTTSDARLKHDIATLTGELALMQGLRPVTFRWNADNSPGVGFLAHEVAAHVAGVITGEPDALEEDGSIKPQQIDYSKLVPFLVGAVQTLAARVAVLEDALGI